MTHVNEAKAYVVDASEFESLIQVCTKRLLAVLAFSVVACYGYALFMSGKELAIAVLVLSVCFWSKFLKSRIKSFFMRCAGDEELYVQRCNRVAASMLLTACAAVCVASVSLFGAIELVNNGGYEAFSFHVLVTFVSMGALLLSAWDTYRLFRSVRAWQAKHF